MSNDFLQTQSDREQQCASHSRNVMFKWFAGGAAVFGGGTLLAHIYCQTSSSQPMCTYSRTTL